MKRTLSGLLLLLSFGSAHSALLSRAGGQAYYDDVLNITWLADANLADTNDFGVAGINANGTMSWNTAQSWIGAMNAANFLGSNNWRLPNIVDTGAPGCDWEFIGTDCGYNVDLGTGEMAHMFYNTLGNVGNYNTSGSSTGCSGPTLCLTNTGPFSNLQSRGYWSGTTYAPTPPDLAAWFFSFNIGSQNPSWQSSELYAWAVIPGDSLAVVPLPGSVWLLGWALGALRLSRRKVLNRDGLGALASKKRAA
jgi:hypothetical protein